MQKRLMVVCDTKPYGMGAFGDEQVKIPWYMWKVVDDGTTWHHVVAVYNGANKTI